MARIRASKRYSRRLAVAVGIACALVAVAIAVVLVSPWRSSVPGSSPGPGEVPDSVSQPTSGGFALVDGELVADNRFEEAQQDVGAASAGRDASGAAVTADDGIAAEHEVGVVLAKVPDGVGVDALNDALSGLDYLAHSEVSPDDIACGWVELALADGVSVPDALERLGASGVVAGAQPNFVYRLLDSGRAAEGPQGGGDASGGDSDAAEYGSVLLPGSVSGVNPPDFVVETGNSKDTGGYHTFINDPEARNQMVILTVQLRETYAYLCDQGYVAPIGADAADGDASENAPLTWTKSDHRTPTIAVLDTGCQISHEDFHWTDPAGNDVTNIVDYYDAVAKKGKSDGYAFRDIHNHGTHVCGIAAALTNNGKGIAGVSLNAGLLPINVFEWKDTELLADSKDILAGYQYVMEHVDDYNIRVVNMSLGSTAETTDNDDKALLEAVDQAYGAGVLTVIAAGNDAGSQGGAYSDFPSDFAPNAVSVIDCYVSGWHSVDDDEHLSDFALEMLRDSYSNYNRPGTVAKPVSALGSSVMSTVPYEDDGDDKYENKDGTSMASPCVAGLAALAWQVDPGLKVDEVKSLLCSTVDDVSSVSEGYNGSDEPTVGFDVYTGFGTVNARRLVRAVVEGAYLSVEGGAPTVMGVGSTLGLSVAAEARDDFDPSGVTWESGDPGVVAVDASGTVTAVGPGQTYVTARYGEGSDAQALYQTMTVYSASISGPSSLERGKSAQLSLDAAPAGGTWRWSSSNSGVSVDEWTGEVVGREYGATATITAALVSNTAVCATTTVSVEEEKTEPTPAPEPEPTPEPAPEPDPDPVVEKRAMHRLYNPNSGEHFYTYDDEEWRNVVAAGWSDEGMGWTAPEKSSTPVYRLYNQYGGEHHYTMDASERDMLVGAGWNDEGVGWYSDDAKAVPLYRLYNPNAFANNHHYTTSASERDWLLGLGWRDESIAWYGV